jgi:hypothetical protein
MLNKSGVDRWDIADSESDDIDGSSDASGDSESSKLSKPPRLIRGTIDSS